MPRDLAPQREPVRARVAVHRHDSGRAKMRKMVVSRRACNAGGLRELGESGVAGREPTEHANAPLVGEGAPEQQRAFLEAFAHAQRVADDPRAPVLAEEQPWPGGDMRDEHDAVERRLGLVAVAAASPPRSTVSGGSSSRRLVSTSRSSSGTTALSKRFGGEPLENREHAPLRLRRGEREKRTERFARLPCVVALVVEERGVACGRRLERCAPRRASARRERARRRDGGAARRPACSRTAPTMSAGRSSASPSRWSHSSADRTPTRPTSLLELGAAGRELGHPAGTGGRAVGARERREADQQLERRARDELGAQGLRSRRRIVYEFRRAHSIIFER